MSAITAELIQAINAGKPISLTQDVSIAFIDLLGFKTFLKEDINGAQMMMSDSLDILAIKVNELKHFHPDRYPTEELATLAEASSTSSFLLVYPISDSVILVSENPDLFAVQMAHFISECFHYKAHVYEKELGGNPTEITLPVVELNSKGDLKRSELHEHWYPTLFKGGVAFGTLRLYPSKVLAGGKLENSLNFLGEGYLTAYQFADLHGPRYRGPRLFCHPSFIGKLSPDVNQYIVFVAENEKIGPVHELIWPALMYHEGNNPEIEANELPGRINPIIALAQHYNTEPAHSQYREFLILEARGALMFFKNQNAIHLAVDKLKQILPMDLLYNIPEWPEPAPFKWRLRKFFLNIFSRNTKPLTFP